MLIDTEGNAVRETKWPVNRAGFVIHSAIHGALSDAHCVMHTHTTTGVAVASLKEGLSPNNFYGAMLVGQVAYHEFEGITVEPGEKDRLVKSIGKKPAVILRNHGLLAWGPSVSQAFVMLWTQRACDVQIAAARRVGQSDPARGVPADGARGRSRREAHLRRRVRGDAASGRCARSVLPRLTLT